jgi:acyl carrier protein
MLTVEDVIDAVHRVRQNKGLPPIGISPDSKPRDLELDSLDTAEILVLLEGRAGGELDLFAAGPIVCLRDFARLKPRFQDGDGEKG